MDTVSVSGSTTGLINLCRGIPTLKAYDFTCCIRSVSYHVFVQNDKALALCPRGIYHLADTCSLPSFPDELFNLTWRCFDADGLLVSVKPNRLDRDFPLTNMIAIAQGSMQDRRMLYYILCTNMYKGYDWYS